MSETKFTPGPWNVLMGTYNKYAGKFASIVAPYPIDESPKQAFEITKIFSNKAYSVEQVEIDAALIAAAPDLYEALNHIHNELSNYVEGTDYFCHLLRKAEEALEKAKGKKP